MNRCGTSAFALMAAAVLVLANSGEARCGELCVGAAACGGESCQRERSYGPCPHQERLTLMQWSYGTSFSGGPPGRDEPLASDRPDFTEASTTVGRGVVQIESGYTFIRDRDGGSTLTAHSFPETLLRVGVLAEWLELRAAYNYGVETTQFGGTATELSGSEDLYLGVKLGLTPQEGILPEMALMPQMTVPTGSSAFGAGEVLPGLNWLYGWDINDFLSTAGSTQVNRALDGVTGEPYLEFAQSWTIGYSLAERVGAYTEIFTLVPDGADTDKTQTYFNGGFVFPVTNDLQFDIRAGLGLNEAADDFFSGAGLVMRL